MATTATGKVAEVSGDGKLITDIDLVQVSAAVGNEETRVEFGGHEPVGLLRNLMVSQRRRWWPALVLRGA